MAVAPYPRHLDERSRLEGGVAGDTPVAGVAKAGLRKFDAVLSGVRRAPGRDRVNARPLRGVGSKWLVADGVISREVEALIEHIVKEVLPGLDLAPEMAAIAAEILAEEVEVARSLNRRIAEAQSGDVRGQ